MVGTDVNESDTVPVTTSNHRHTKDVKKQSQCYEEDIVEDHSVFDTVLNGAFMRESLRFHLIYDVVRAVRTTHAQNQSISNTISERL